MTKKLITSSAGVLIVLGLIAIGLVIVHRPSTAGHAKPAANSTVVSSSESSTKISSNRDQPSLTDQDVVGIWDNHHNKNIHQQITFTADHKWRENQHHITNIYSGTWKLSHHNQILLAPYDETIQLYGKHFDTMNVLSYDHILTKEVQK